MSQELADFVRSKCPVIAVSNAYELAPDALALVSNDTGWWREHPKAKEFAGRKFCSAPIPGVEHLKPSGLYSSASNSGLQGMRVAELYFGATRILLCGFDMHAKNGQHYFGLHPPSLKNTTADRFKVHLRQFSHWRGCEVINCTPGSALTHFPMMDIHDALLLP